MTTSGIAAKRAGCSVETIRYYERIGLLSAPPRARNGRRSYGEGEIKQLMFVRRCRDLGFALKEIQTLVALSGQSKQNCGQVKQIAEAHTNVVRRKMTDLARIDAWLSGMIGQCGATPRRDCPLIETLFAAPAA